MDKRIETMKAELRARRAAANATAGTTPPEPKVKVSFAERLGRGLAKTKNAVVNSVTGISDTVDAIGTSYSYYNEMPPAEQCDKAAQVEAPKRRRTATA